MAVIMMLVYPFLLHHRLRVPRQTEFPRTGAGWFSSTRLWLLTYPFARAGQVLSQCSRGAWMDGWNSSEGMWEQH